MVGAGRVMDDGLPLTALARDSLDMNLGLLIGALAGSVSALLFASASAGTLIGVLVLTLLSPLPVAIAGLGWGWRAAAIAAATAVLLLALLANGRAALVHALALGIPTAVLSHFLLLARPVAPAAAGAPPQLEWYPIGRIVAWAALIAGVLGALALLTTASDVDTLRTSLRQTLDRFVKIGGTLPGGYDRPLGEKEVAALTELMVVTFAGAIATLWIAIAILNLWIAGHVTRLSGQLKRPWPDLSMMVLPRELPLALAAAIALTFLPGMLGLAASGFVSALIVAYMLAGLAILHYLTRGMGARPAILIAVYGALMILNPFSGLLLAIAGIAEPVSPLRRVFPNTPST